MRYRGRSAVAFFKRLQTLRVPAGDPASDCVCEDYLLTEAGQPILTEGGANLKPESSE